MTSEKLINSIVKHHREQTKNFSGFTSFLYGAVGILSLVIVFIMFAIAFINPLWFRESLLDFAMNNVPGFFRDVRESLFKSYKDKVNLFDTLKQ